MITEDYVSFDTAKLLKEKGFDENCEYYYNTEVLNKNGFPCFDSIGMEYSNTELEQSDKEYVCYSAPTLQMAMKWLREVHNLYITITHRFSHNADNDICFGYYININTACDGEWLTYEQTCEVAIKYCLENLI